MTHQLGPVLKALGFNSLKVHHFQAVSFKVTQLAPLRNGAYYGPVVKAGCAPCSATHPTSQCTSVPVFTLQRHRHKWLRAWLCVRVGRDKAGERKLNTFT